RSPMTDPASPPSDLADLAPPERRRAPRWERVALVAGPIVLVLVVLSITVRLPYVIFSPGSATPVAGAVMIDGVPTEEVEGAVLFLTVRVSNERPNVWRLGAAWLDGNSEIMSEDEYLQGFTRQQSKRIDVVSMDQSQETAKAVALRRLGYDVPIV